MSQFWRLVLAGGWLSGYRWLYCHCVLTWWKGQGSSLKSLYKGSNSIHEGSPHDLITSQRPKSTGDSVQFSCSVVSDSLQPHGLQHASLPCPSPTPETCSNSCPLSWWCHPTISSSVVRFSSCLQSFPASGSFPMSQFFANWGLGFTLWIGWERGKTDHQSIYERT